MKDNFYRILSTAFGIIVLLIVSTTYAVKSYAKTTDIDAIPKCNPGTNNNKIGCICGYSVGYIYKDMYKQNKNLADDTPTGCSNGLKCVAMRPQDGSTYDSLYINHSAFGKPYPSSYNAYMEVVTGQRRQGNSFTRKRFTIASYYVKVEPGESITPYSLGRSLYGKKVGPSHKFNEFIGTCVPFKSKRALP